MSTIDVLLVEDHDGDALIITELLEASSASGNVDLRRARTLADGRVAVADQEPDLVLLDLGLPDGSGIGVIEDMRAEAPAVPVVVLTGATDPDLPRLALQAGAQDYLVKGDALTPDVVARAIRYALDRSIQIRALELSRAELRDFAHQVAHDLRSPLTSVLGFLELVRQRSEGEDAEMLGIAKRSAHRLTDMVDHLLSFVEQAGSEGVLHPVDLDDVVDWAVAALDSELDGADVMVERPLGDVHANRTALRHSVLNLLSNASKYAHPERALCIAVSSSTTDGRVRLDVTDNGRGIPESDRKRVFEGGYRRGDESGTGLGLASVRRTVRLFGGSVRIDDGIAGAGITVSIELPAVRV